MCVCGQYYMYVYINLHVIRGHGLEWELSGDTGGLVAGRRRGRNDINTLLMYEILKKFFLK